MNTRGGASATLKKRERNGWIFCFLKTSKKLYKTFFLSELLIFCNRKRKMSDSLKKTSNSLIRSFVLSDLSQSLTFAHLSWATWAIRSFFLSDLSKWANDWWANEWWAKEQIPNPRYHKCFTGKNYVNARHWSDDKVLAGRAIFRGESNPGRLVLNSVSVDDR